MGGRHVLQQGLTTIGRDPGCTIALTWEPSVSRSHAELRVSPAGVVFKDVGSTNGSFIDGEPVTGERLLAEGQTIVLGKCVLRLTSEA
jgi:pSer/pThr/pTyr-binding forkhead associated (FHA) protein